MLRCAKFVLLILQLYKTELSVVSEYISQESNLQFSKRQSKKVDLLIVIFSNTHSTNTPLLKFAPSIIDLLLNLHLLK